MTHPNPLYTPHERELALDTLERWLDEPERIEARQDTYDFLLLMLSEVAESDEIERGLIDEDVQTVLTGWLFADEPYGSQTCAALALLQGKEVAERPAGTELAPGDVVAARLLSDGCGEGLRLEDFLLLPGDAQAARTRIELFRDFAAAGMAHARRPDDGEEAWQECQRFLIAKQFGPYLLRWWFEGHLDRSRRQDGHRSA
ncbi:MAG: hypothetical protein H8E31_01545 [Planctomycetes bacterium]|nr:hypothetical protein [Planctomycetota bacterium]